MTADPPAVLSIGAAAIDEWYAVSNLPAPDGGAYASEVTTAFGGVGANVAVALDRLGRDVGLVSRVGDDEYGDVARRRLAETGVDTAHVAVGEDPQTRSLILRDPDGERAIVTAGESFRGLRLDEAALDAIPEADAVFLTAYAPDAVARRVLDRVEALRAAAEGGDAADGDDAAGDGAPTDPPALVFDLSGPVAELVGRGTEPETVHRFYHRADVFLAGGVAAPAFFGSASAAVDRLRAAQRAAAAPRSRSGASWPRAVLTHGADGMTAVAGGTVERHDAFEVETVDATGAGDAFAAGVIDRWTLGEAAPVAAGVTFAAAVAAINCTARFTQPGLPTRAETTAFLAARDRGER